MTDADAKELQFKAKEFNEAFIDLMQCVNRLLLIGATEGPRRAEKVTQNYSGNCCPSCGMFMVVRTGTCLTCQSCGWNGGCG